MIALGKLKSSPKTSPIKPTRPSRQLHQSDHQSDAESAKKRAEQSGRFVGE
jgi:hypothetical protein